MYKGKAGKLFEKKETIKSLRKKIKKQEYLGLKELALCRKIEINYEDVLGEWNGYGYERLGKVVEDKNALNALNTYAKKINTEFRKCKKVKKEKTEMTEKEKEEKKIKAWCKRLSKLTGITEDEADRIAGEKINYQNEKIYEMVQRQSNGFSVKREKLIHKMERENPLRRIQHEEHAQAILAAHRRHTMTDYDYELDRAREQAEYGEIDREEVREVAREAIRDSI